MLHHDVVVAVGTRSVSGVALLLGLTVVLVMLRNRVREAFGRTAMLLWFACQFGLEVASKIRVNHHYFCNSVLVSVELVLEEPAVLSINAGLKLVRLDASIEAELKIAEQIGHPADIGPVLHINEVMFALLQADRTELIFAIAFGEALLAENAITVQDESACVFEAEVAFVAVHLELFVH